ncbi:hypothetical protein BGZ81_000169 [Podila clonocystis]|nr:hypothetical protein BGZ81_000169 [Podila clonocystis]
MIENKAWGDLTDYSSSQEQSQAGDDMDYSFEGSVQEDEDQMDRQQSPPVSPHESSTPCSVGQLGQSIQHSLRLQSDLSLETSTEGNDEEERDPDMYDENNENSNPDSDEDRYLPELTINVVDPEASHFDELLYYASDGSRWRVFFRPDNYVYILQNIAHLNILTMHVLDICLAFEQTTQPQMQLRGLALQLLHKSSLLGPRGPGVGLSPGSPDLPDPDIISQNVDGEEQ